MTDDVGDGGEAPDIMDKEEEEMKEADSVS
jgi:hypothetical protein